jgi:hypothetical protein
MNDFNPCLSLCARKDVRLGEWLRAMKTFDI